MAVSGQQVTYHEPSLPQLLTLIAFFYSLQVARTCADYVFGAGLLGESELSLSFAASSPRSAPDEGYGGTAAESSIADQLHCSTVGVGVVFGPVAKIMLAEWEATIVAIGYIGLVIIVFGESAS